MVVEEFKPVALLDEISVAVISESNTIFLGSVTSRIIVEVDAIILGKLSAESPGCGFSSVCGRVAEKNGLPK